MSLTDTACKNAKHKGSPKKMSDAGGLYLLVTPTAKLWNVAYRFGGKQKKLSLRCLPFGDARRGPHRAG